LIVERRYRARDRERFPNRAQMAQICPVSFDAQLSVSAMDQLIDTDLAIIGAGSAGLSVAAGAVQMGARVVLIERDRMGGDCLNVGCVPSKSLIAAAHAAHAVRTAGRFGVNGHEPSIDFARVNQHVRGVIAAIAPHDSEERFTRLGVRVLRESARFLGERELQVGSRRVRARRIVLATGSRPAVPPIDGLGDVPFLTNETIFELTDRPEHLLVIGGGPIGVELAQAHRRLGSQVSLLEKFSILPKDDADAVAIVRRRLEQEGVQIDEGADIERVERQGNGITVRLGGSDAPRRRSGSHLLIAAGRRANIEDLDLDKGGIRFTASGIEVDAGLRTTNRRVYAIGDVTGGYQFTHMAAHHASVVVRNALFWLPARVETRAVPWVTYSDPELAHVGLTEAMAREQGRAVHTLTAGLAENDRARAERQTEGFIKLVIERGRPIGATIVGPHAGELIHIWVLAVQERIKLARIAQMIAPYPTLGEIGKRAAGSWFTPSLFSGRTRRIVRFLQAMS
jgi:pyruvate/2-oxoglutarate dehydrogenase complex dihydrolipoamide dehydrogenase (E3) component